MIETEGTRNDTSNAFGNDPFFNSNDDYDQTGLDNFDNTELFGMMNDDRAYQQHHNDDYGLVRDLRCPISGLKEKF